MDIEDKDCGMERQAFEAWVTATPHERSVERFTAEADSHCGQYRDPGVQLAWEAWCEVAGEWSVKDTFCHDPRPAKGLWAPGEYLCKCSICGASFVGAKRAGHCADCAYNEEPPPETCSPS